MEKYATNHEAFLTKFKSQCDEREAGSCCCSVAKSCPTLWDPWTAAHQASLSLTISQSLPKFTSIESVMPSNYLILCYPLLLRPSIFPSIRVFSNESVLCTRWSKYWSFSFSISPSNEYSGLSSFKIDWFGLLAVSRDSQVSQFEGINSLAPRLLYSHRTVKRGRPLLPVELD